MKKLREIYVELMKQRKSVCRDDFIECYFAYKNGEVKKFASYSEAQKFSDNIEIVHNEKLYKEAVGKNDQIKHHAEQEIKLLMKERLGVTSDDKFGNILFELSFELGEKTFDEQYNSYNYRFSYDDKDYLFSLVSDYYAQITKHITKERLQEIFV